MSYSKYVQWFEELSIADVAEVGGKNASLGELYRELSPKGINVPNGFAVNVKGYWDTLNNKEGVLNELENLLRDMDIDSIHDLEERSQQARKLIYDAPLPEDLVQNITQAFKKLISFYSKNISVSVRSSATAEDLPTASFAGQHDSFLNIHTVDELLISYKKCLASLFNSRAIAYRVNNNFDHFKVALSVGIMKMVRSDLASSGVMFSIDAESGFKDAVFITASYGLGENIVQGNVSPDEFYVHKPTFEKGYRAVLRRHIGAKSNKMIYANNGNAIQQVDTADEDKKKYCISDKEILKLAEYAINVENHYSAKVGKFRPMDMEWAKDGIDGQLYLIQARPETIISQQDQNILEHHHLLTNGEIIITGRAASTKIAAGKARIITNDEQLADLQFGDVLIAENTSPDWGPVFKKVSAIVTNRGGRTCHAAIVAREHGIPAIVGTEHATEKIQDGQLITVSCAEGKLGKVYAGELDYEIIKTDLSSIQKPKTKLMINLGNPDLAFKYSFLPCDGVGLARMEFIINEHIGIHPMALMHLDKVDDLYEREKIENLVENYNSPQEYYIETLSEGVATIAAAFYPRPVIVRMSDFKTNEYANLIGGAYFEPAEENPMLGFRGASRYVHPDFAEGFALECKAMHRVRDVMGLDNVIIMIPFCRRLEEGKAVLDAMSSYNLCRGINGLKIYMMCEIPNNVILIDEFLDLFDGMSIGSNDLTQLTLGVDRDSESVSFDFDERDPGVLRMIKIAVEGAKRNMRYSGICGQAPSDYPEITEFLVNLGIDSISLSPDSLLETIARVNKLETKKVKLIV